MQYQIKWNMSRVDHYNEVNYPFLSYLTLLNVLWCWWINDNILRLVPMEVPTLEVKLLQLLQRHQVRTQQQHKVVMTQQLLLGTVIVQVGTFWWDIQIRLNIDLSLKLVHTVALFCYLLFLVARFFQYSTFNFEG